MVGGHAAVARDVIPYGTVYGERATLRGLNIVGLRRHGIETVGDQEVPVRVSGHFQEQRKTSGTVRRNSENLPAATIRSGKWLNSSLMEGLEISAHRVRSTIPKSEFHGPSEASSRNHRRGRPFCRRSLPKPAMPAISPCTSRVITIRVDFPEVQPDSGPDSNVRERYSLGWLTLAARTSFLPENSAGRRSTPRTSIQPCRSMPIGCSRRSGAVMTVCCGQSGPCLNVRASE